ncbi:MAG TPA: helix-turn-helix domain-containing protein [Spongiibacteraceae bacterium]
MSLHSVQLKPARAVGRPASLEPQAVFDAALEIGLDKVTMKAVADHLGVGISTLYQYVKNRSELVRLAALRQVMRREPPQYAAAHWAEVAVRYAENLLQSLVDQPQLVVELIKGGLGPHTEVDILERFLAEMQRYDFSPEEGIRFYRSLSLMTIGAAVGILNYAGAHERGAPHHIAIKRLFIERAPDELPLIRAAATEFEREDIRIWFTALHDLINGVAAARNEKLPRRLLASLNSTLLTKQTPIPAKTNNSGNSSTAKKSPKTRTRVRRK